MRKSQHNRILRQELKEQHLSIVSKPYPIVNMNISDKFNESDFFNNHNKS